MTDPWASRTASLTIFSEAISSRLYSCRSVSFWIAAKTSGSVCCKKDMMQFPLMLVFAFVWDSNPQFFFHLSDFIYPALVPASRERSVKPDLQNLFSKRALRYPTPQDEDIGIVVLSTHLRPAQIMNQRRPDTGEFVCQHGHADSVRANQDASLGLSFSDLQGN